MTFRLSSHAVERYQIHHPNANRHTVWRAFASGMPVNQERVRQILERSYVSLGDGYILPPDRRGVFVINRDDVIVTYLRCSEKHRRALRYRWPVRQAA